MDIIPAPHKSSFDPNCGFSNYLLIVDTYSRIPRMCGLNELHSEAVMDKIEEFVARYGEVNKFGWWNIGRIQADAGPQFTSEEFLQKCVKRGIHLSLDAPEHQEQNEISEKTWHSL